MNEQITNQMITACKTYITHASTETIWTQPSPQVLKRIGDCLKLYEEYQVSFHHMKKALKEASMEAEAEAEAAAATNGDGFYASSRPQTAASGRSGLSSARQHTTGSKLVELSDMYILGKFETFVRRLKRIVDMFNTCDVYGRLALAKIEGASLVELYFLEYSRVCTPDKY